MKKKSALNQTCTSRAKELDKFRLYIISVGFLSTLVVKGTLSYAVEISSASRAEQEILNRRLWESRQWEKILFIPDRIFPSKRSVIDDPKFFLSPIGKLNPKEELIATWRSFSAPQETNDLDSHPQCVFPARKRWILRQLNLSPSDLPKVSCPRLETYLGLSKYHGASIVFSNYFLGNPGSMFGHTLLTFHTSRKTGEAIDAKSNMFADVLNFSAMIEDSSAFLYPLKGLFGYFPGRFALMPFYRKIQEYNNGESRDLWEYELKLTDTELQDAPFLIWELGPIYADYFYFDDNCAQLLLMFLEALRPSLHISGELAVYSIPADTIRVVADVPGLTGKITHKASSLSRYIYRLGLLNEREIDYLSKLIGDQNHFEPTSPLFDSQSQAKILDAATEWIDFTEKVVGSQSTEEYGPRRHELLKARAQTGVIDPPVEIPVQSTAPHLGHDSGGLGVAVTRSLRPLENDHPNGPKPAIELSLRPALHDSKSPGLGYSDELEILFLDFLFRKEAEKQLQLEKLKLLSILSIPKKIPFVEQSPWKVELGFERSYSFQSRPETGKIYLQGGRGVPLSFSNFNLFGYALISPEVFWSKDHQWSLGPKSSLGIFMSPSLNTKLSLSSEWARYFNKTSILTSAIANFSFSVRVERNWELRAELEKQNQRSEAKLRAISYF
jgi:hypothetical protein